MIAPIGDRVLIRRKVEESKSGIILEEDGMRKLPVGTVLALGDGNAVQESSLSINDQVHFNAMAGEEVEDGDERLILVKLNDVLGRIV